MSKLTKFRKISRSNHADLFAIPLMQNSSRPVIEGWVGKTFHSPLLYFLAPSAPSLPGPQPPTVPTPVPAPINSDVNLMIFD